ncbi:hypothetical protein [Sphingobium boeckii]|uniref:Uncharacterized protein n=1 Tax=Sphingobium boeckii TaxID=1082345 RepID=A0A7W9ALM3_9SPHN|nr:hypothetical protein [Sphingobium boeckii]MBB5687776.1 hypothetical protein [Sphingobium boeckii]
MGPSNNLVEAKSAARKAFTYYLRTGRRVPESMFKPKHLEVKFNPYHDPLNGRFTFAPGGPRSLSHILVSNQRDSSTLKDPRFLGSELIFTRQNAHLSSNQQSTYQNLLKPAQYRPNPRARRGHNSGAFQDPLTLQHIFPNLRNAPSGAIIAIAANIFDFTGPGDALTSALTKEYSNVLIDQIQNIDPNYHFESLGFPKTMEGQKNQIQCLRIDRAEAIYRILGEVGPLQIETIRFLQQKVDEAYQDGIQHLKSGKLSVFLSPHEAIGNYVDRQVRNELKQFYNRIGISPKHDSQVRVVGREYDTSGNDRTYTTPDARVGKLAIDWTLTPKTGKTKQIIGFFNGDFKPDATAIIRPSQRGVPSIYLIKRPGKR